MTRVSTTRPVGPRTRRIFAAVVVAQSAIVVTGGLVRLTGSGLGCPTWPECAPGSYVPTLEQAEGVHSYIEFGNRLLTFLLSAVVIAAAVAAWRHRPHRRDLLALAGLQLVGVAAQATLGGITVLTGLNPATVAAHFLLSMVLIAGAVVLLEVSGRVQVSPPVRPEIRWLGGALLVVAALVLVVGTVVTGSGPHSGDAAAPARFGFDPQTVSWLHADLVFLFLGLALAMVLALRVTDAPGRAQRRAAALLAVIVAQGAVGYVQYFTGVPAALVALHMIGACLVVITTVRLALALFAESVPADEARSLLATADRAR
jgi:cytochrome c oxidase assembly protein subunit 15